MPEIINFVGKSNTGKTRIIEKVITYITNRGYSVGVIKHDVHGFEIDHENKDTYKHRKAGASTVIISNAKSYAMIKEVKEEEKLEDLIKFMMDKDLVIVEGYKASKYDKIELLRESMYKESISERKYLKAIIADFKYVSDDSRIKIFGDNDYELVAQYIIENYIY